MTPSQIAETLSALATVDYDDLTAAIGPVSGAQWRAWNDNELKFIRLLPVQKRKALLAFLADRIAARAGRVAA